MTSPAPIAQRDFFQNEHQQQRLIALGLVNFIRAARRFAKAHATRQQREADAALLKWHQLGPTRVWLTANALHASKLSGQRAHGTLLLQPFQFTEGAWAKLVEVIMSVPRRDGEPLTPTAETLAQLRAFLGWIARARLLGVAFIAEHGDLAGIVDGWIERTGQRWLPILDRGAIVHRTPHFKPAANLPQRRSRTANIYHLDESLFLWGAIAETLREQGDVTACERPDYTAAGEWAPPIELLTERGAPSLKEEWRGIQGDLPRHESHVVMIHDRVEELRIGSLATRVTAVAPAQTPAHSWGAAAGGADTRDATAATTAGNEGDTHDATAATSGGRWQGMPDETRAHLQRLAKEIRDVEKRDTLRVFGDARESWRRSVRSTVMMHTGEPWPGELPAGVGELLDQAYAEGRPPHEAAELVITRLAASVT